MAANTDGAHISGGATLVTPFCRQNELKEITKQLQHAGCSTIFLSSEMGMGTTFLLRELAKSMSVHSAVISLQGTPSLAAIPYGILASFLRRNTATFVESHVDAIRKILVLVAEQEARLRENLGAESSLGKPLLIIDEADYIDGATAQVVASLAQARKIKLVLAHRDGNELVSPLPQLWDTGVAEKFRLRSLTLEEGHAFCQRLLGGQPTAITSWYFWNSAGGNPLLMRLVMEDALESEKLLRRNGLWVMDMEAVPAGHQLQSVVREQLRGLSSGARRTLDLVALSEPVAVETVSRLMGGTLLAELLERHLLQESPAGSKLLRLINPVYGEVIRDMVPRGQSRMLHSRLISELKTAITTPESSLRLVIWALESGMTVPDDDLLRAAIFACKLYESGVALRLADQVSGAENHGRAHAIKARARFNGGDYATAAALLEHHPEQAVSVAELMFGGLLRASVKSALGLPAKTIHDDATTLRAHADRLASNDPVNAADILERAQERATIIDLMAHSRAGNYGQMQESLDKVLARTTGSDDVDHLCNRSVALALDAERLSALGQPVAGMAQASAAFSIVQAEDHDVYFIPEMIITRAQVATLTAGHWQEAEQLLGSFTVDIGHATISFGGSVGVARGMMLLRQGRTVEALRVLLDGLEALQHSDPQQLLGYCAAMAAYAAAKVGRLESARELVQQYTEDTGMFIVIAHERAYMAAAREYLDRDGTGVAELFRIADECAARGLLTCELNALALAMEFEPSRPRRRIRTVATNVQGPWAAGLASYAAALEQKSASVLVRAAEQLLEAQMYQHAGRALRLASAALDKNRESQLSRQIREGFARVEAAVGVPEESGEGASNGHRRVRERLTPRELELALMAAQGMSDKDIATALHVSVRTVEGHLYRAYAKLEITDRHGLGEVLSD